MNGAEPRLVAPHVLVMVRAAVLAVPGVAGLASDSSAAASADASDGVVVRQNADGMVVDCLVTAVAGSNLAELGITIQATVAVALERFAGWVAQEVNVYILDVEFRRG